MSENVLFVSWCPLNLLRPRAVQVGRVAKGIRQYGWRASLICARYHGEIEQDMFDVELESFYRPAFRRIGRLLDPDFRGDDGTGRPNNIVASGLLAKLYRDRQSVPWTEAATGAVRRLVRFHRWPIVMSFGQPWTSHFVGLQAKLASPRIRWIAHFSDPWVDNPYLGISGEAELETMRREERAIIEGADALVFVTEDTADLVMRKYPSEWRRKVRVIPHMLDLELVPLIETRTFRREGRLRLTHAGNLYAGRRAPIGLFEALRDLRQNGLLDRKIEVRFIGEMPPSATEIIDAYDLRNCLSWSTPLYYLPSLREMQDSDVLVVIDADFGESPFLPSKVIDYLMFEKPIVGLTPPNSATSRFLKAIGYRAVGPNDAKAIKELILELLRNWRNKTLSPTEAHLEARRAHDVGPIGAQYVDLFESLRA